jgi:electron transport complex protein RnfB
MVKLMGSAILTAVITIAGIALAAGLLLSVVSRLMPADENNLVETVNDLLPQTQCAQCGYPGCRPYADAIVNKDEVINLCPPGGNETVKRLAALLGRDPLPLEVDSAMAPTLAVINEALCIGCTHCRNVCPVDAIVGAHQLMHTVIAQECTGCELCIDRCPVDCIDMRPAA